MMYTLSSAEMVSSRPRITPCASASDVAQRVADVVHLGARLKGALAEERQQHHFQAEGFGDADAVAHPFLAELIVFEVVVVQPVDAGGSQRDAVFLGFGEVGLLDLGIVERQLVTDQLASERYLNALKAALLGHGDGRRFGAEAEIPIRDSDREIRLARSP
jgi:hypothetical protein